MGDKCRPQKGDRVRVVLESTVGYVDSGGFTVQSNGFRFEQEDLVSVKKIEPPLPTTPGSVVRGRLTHTHYFLTRDGWVGPYNDAAYVENRANYEVVSDAGKAL